jgi:hypothetical protein
LGDYELGRLFASHAAGSTLNRSDDGWITGASAECIFEGGSDFVLARGGISLEKGVGCHDLTGNAKTTLNRSGLHERLLKWMEAFILSYAFDRDNVTILHSPSWINAGDNRFTIDQNGTRTTLGFATPDFRAGQSQSIT